jgi:hypothetical protein
VERNAVLELPGYEGPTELEYARPAPAGLAATG